MIKVPTPILTNPDEALTREWLVTNGKGGYASSTSIGANARRYHGLLVASFPPPLERQVVLSKVDEELIIDDNAYALGTNEYQDGTIHPQGYQYLKTFKLELGIPTFEYCTDGVTLIKQIWMEHGKDTVYMTYRLMSEGEATLRIHPFCAFRGYHHDGQRTGQEEFIFSNQGALLTVSSGHTPYHLMLCASPTGEFEPGEDWYRSFLYRREGERGYDCLEDLYTPGTFVLRLTQGETVGLIASCERSVIDQDIPAAYKREMDRRREIAGQEKNSFRKQLLLSADQFVVTSPGRESMSTSKSMSILAGYHWFTDWGRDTMIALPGLLLSTGRFAEARDILLRYIECADGGMIPNRFTDEGLTEYNTADATLWYFQALHAYVGASGDQEIIRQLLPSLAEIIDHHIHGTRFDIHVDPSDGLLHAGRKESQLTWMDARVDDHPVTPRIGKPVEINALWYNALCLTSAWMGQNGISPEPYESAAEKCRDSFQRKFWNGGTGCLYDVVDGPSGNDPSIRPNQIMAVSLPHSPLDTETQKAVVNLVERDLLTPIGLRTLAPSDLKYIGEYRGGPSERDSSYHQGTVWPWLLGQFADAHYRVYADKERIARLIKPLHKHLSEAGLGSISEIFDAEYPHKPNGTIAQAWSIAEILRILTEMVDR